MNVLESKRETKPLGADELFGQSIGENFKEVIDARCKVLVKLKIQELIFNAKVELLSIRANQNLFSTTEQSRNSYPVYCQLQEHLVTVQTVRIIQARLQVSNQFFLPQCRHFLRVSTVSIKSISKWGATLLKKPRSYFHDLAYCLRFFAKSSICNFACREVEKE